MRLSLSGNLIYVFTQKNVGKDYYQFLTQEENLG